ncbi:tyrosyl-DNA phosphodiesterase 2-like isoform X2 [Zingiber officinale]|uniref:tyrosyl-DNA phosphodiesterase 2-like isoform X2 n=1 Tax=Zingiber officinale TaxID=94328 RepID=UPI001C4B8ADB|nr:tyrosyl-DNA phosphodiesterase 2-like isoform X2 [Zingiber officinale]
MGNSVSSPGGKAIAIAGGAVVLALGASYLWDFLSNDASSTPDAPASRIRNKLAEEVLTDPRNRDGFANGSEASSTRDAPASGRTKLAEEASVTLRPGKMNPKNRHGYPRGSEEFPRRIRCHPMPQFITIVTYNIWQQDVKLNERMKAIGELMQALNMPDIILFQEVTPEIRKIFKEFKWWQQYKCVSHKTPTTKHFCLLLSKLPVKVLGLEHCKDSIMKKKLIVAEVEALGKRRSLVVANGHLKRPNLPDESHTNKRTAQAKEAITILGNYNNAIFGGDMNWSEDLDGCFPLPNGWVDAWERLRPFENGWTYDNVSNQMMIKGKRRLRKRLDRFLCKLKDYKLACIEIIGKDIIPGLRHQHREKDYPVLCSDHFGLLLRISI